MKHLALVALLSLSLAVLPVGAYPLAHAQHTALEPTAPPPEAHRQRLYLRDGSYQIVMSYKVLRDRVRYTSAERGGDTEEVPLDLVDLSATRQWEQRQQLGRDTEGSRGQRAVLDPELAKEEADRAAVTPVVATTADGELRLPLEDSVLALDTFQGTPELVPLAQQSSDLNKKTGHGIARLKLNPAASSHDVVTLSGESADVDLHVNQPEFYLRVGEAADLPTGAAAMTVDTHGASATADAVQKPSGASRYVILRMEVRQDARVAQSFRPAELGTGARQPDLTETRVTTLPGGHWIKVVAAEELLIGQYCLLEVLPDGALNSGVWDFGVHPRAPENREAILPEKRRAVGLQRRGPE